MLNLTECKKIINEDQKVKYTDDEIIQIRDWLYKMADLTLEAELVRQLLVETK